MSCFLFYVSDFILLVCQIFQKQKIFLYVNDFISSFFDIQKYKYSKVNKFMTNINGPAICDCIYFLRYVSLYIFI